MATHALSRDFPQKSTLKYRCTAREHNNATGMLWNINTMSIWGIVSPQPNHTCREHGRFRYILRVPDPRASPVAKALPAACPQQDAHSVLHCFLT